MIRAFGPILNDNVRFIGPVTGAAAVDVAWLATRPAGVTEPYGELVQHRVILGYDAC